MGPFSQGVAQKLGEWKSCDGEAVCHWGIIEGSPGPALIITNDRDEPQHIIPIEALEFISELLTRENPANQETDNVLR